MTPSRVSRSFLTAVVTAAITIVGIFALAWFTDTKGFEWIVNGSDNVRSYPSPAEPPVTTKDDAGRPLPGDKNR